MSTKEVEEMKEFMTILTEVKVSLAEQSVKLDNLLDMNNKLNRTYDVAMSALSKAEENEKDIAEIKKQMAEKASKKRCWANR